MSINPKCIANLPTANIKELQKQYKKGPLNPGSVFEWIKHPIKQDPLWAKGKWPSIITIAKSVSDQHQISIKPIDLAWHNFNTRDAKEINFYLKHLSNCTEVDRRKRNFRFSNKPNFDEIFWKPVAKKEPPKKQKNVPKHKPATLNDKDCDYIISSECPHNDPNGNLKPGQECKCKCIFDENFDDNPDLKFQTMPPCKRPPISVGIEKMATLWSADTKSADVEINEYDAFLLSLTLRTSKIIWHKDIIDPGEFKWTRFELMLDYSKEKAKHRQWRERGEAIKNRHFSSDVTAQQRRNLSDPSELMEIATQTRLLQSFDVFKRMIVRGYVTQEEGSVLQGKKTVAADNRGHDPHVQLSLSRANFIRDCLIKDYGLEFKKGEALTIGCGQHLSPQREANYPPDNNPVYQSATVEFEFSDPPPEEDKEFFDWFLDVLQFWKDDGRKEKNKEEILSKDMTNLWCFDVYEGPNPKEKIQQGKQRTPVTIRRLISSMHGRSRPVVVTRSNLKEAKNNARGAIDFFVRILKEDYRMKDDKIPRETLELTSDFISSWDVDDDKVRFLPFLNQFISPLGPYATTCEKRKDMEAFYPKGIALTEYWKEEIDKKTGFKKKLNNHVYTSIEGINDATASAVVNKDRYMRFKSAKEVPVGGLVNFNKLRPDITA